MSLPLHTIWYIQSKDRDKDLYPNPFNFSIESPYIAGAQQIAIQWVSFPYTWYNIEKAKNNHFYFAYERLAANEPTYFYDIEIKEGNYNIDELCEEVNLVTSFGDIPKDDSFMTSTESKPSDGLNYNEKVYKNFNDKDNFKIRFFKWDSVLNNWTNAQILQNINDFDTNGKRIYPCSFQFFFDRLTKKTKFYVTRFFDVNDSIIIFKSDPRLGSLNILKEFTGNPLIGNSIGSMMGFGEGKKHVFFTISKSDDRAKILFDNFGNINANQKKDEKATIKKITNFAPLKKPLTLTEIIDPANSPVSLTILLEIENRFISTSVVKLFHEFVFLESKRLSRHNLTDVKNMDRIVTIPLHNALHGSYFIHQPQVYLRYHPLSQGWIDIKLVDDLGQIESRDPDRDNLVILVHFFGSDSILSNK